ncbi:MAG: hypothetical protein ABJN35_02425 [Erythrobacter sp.]
MIIVAEGISAAGKTTFARQFGEGRWLPEIEAKGERPGPDDPLKDHARFWSDHNAFRFQLAQEIEAKHGFAICDTDPMKVHYSWCMERAGFHWPDKFEIAVPFVRDAISERRLGFADLYLVKRIEPEIARAQKEGDATRRRGNFDQHLALQPHLIDWFSAMSGALPGCVRWGFPETDALIGEVKTKTPEDNPRRFDVSVFDDLIRRLPD